MLLENLLEGSDPVEVLPFAARAKVLVRCETGLVPAVKEDAGAPVTFEWEYVVPLLSLSAMVRELWPIVVIKLWVEMVRSEEMDVLFVPPRNS